MKIRRSTCLSIAAHLAFGNLLGLEKECDGEENRESFGRASSDEGFVFRATADFVEASVVLMAYDCHRKGEDEMRERKKRARGAKSQGNERHGGGGWYIPREARGDSPTCSPGNILGGEEGWR